MLKRYFNEIHSLLNHVEEQEFDMIKEGAKKISESIENGGIIHLFGCGHSHILTEEVFYRAGGLVPINPIFHEPLMLHESAVRASQIERENDYANCFMKDVDIRDKDIAIVLSTSGRNPVPVDVALMASDKGAYVIGITSIEYSRSQPSRHKDGLYLFDAVDLVIDNHAPSGDALLSHPKVKVKFTPSSTVVGTTILHAMFAESIKMMADNDINPPVFLSGNIDGADNHNNHLLEMYSNRINF